MARMAGSGTLKYRQFSNSEDVTVGRIADRRRRQRSPWRLAVMAILGGVCAIWIAGAWLPRVEIHADEHGTWQTIRIDWSRTMLGRERQ